MSPEEQIETLEKAEAYLLLADNLIARVKVAAVDHPVPRHFDDASVSVKLALEKLGRGLLISRGIELAGRPAGV